MKTVCFSSELDDVNAVPTQRVTSVILSLMRNQLSKTYVRGFVISSYPRSMRDVMDYVEKVCMYYCI